MGVYFHLKPYYIFMNIEKLKIKTPNDSMLPSTSLERPKLTEEV